MVDKINHEDLGISRLITQYRESTNLINYLKVFLEKSQELEDTLCDVLNERHLDNAEGAQLDIIGELVGISRSFTKASSSFFGFDNNNFALSFGTVEDPFAGGRFLSEGEDLISTRLLTDEEYRIFIKAKIVKNYGSATIEGIISQLNIIFPDTLIVIVEGNLSYEISVGKELSVNEKLVFLDTEILMRPAGVNASYVGEFAEDYFGFQGAGANVSGFANLEDSSLGGELAKLIKLEE